MAIRPNQIFEVLDLAQKVIKNGNNFYPMFVGAPGIAKSSVIQKWCKVNNLPFIDLRAAYLEAPDAIGFPSITEVNGRQVTVHNTPEFWPSEGKGVLLLEEPNRGTTSVMNVFMQLLTDRKVHNYELPKGWMIVGAMNPEDISYEVSTMDPALKNRFQFFEVEYDKQDFLKYMNDNQFVKEIISFVESGTWSYATPEKIDKNSKYVSPRTFEALNSAWKAGIPSDLRLAIFESILGRSIGKLFFAFIENDKPVFVEDLLNPAKKAEAIEQLKKQSNPNDTKSSHLSVTIRDIVDYPDHIEDELVIEVACILPAGLSVAFIKDLEYKRKDYNLFKKLTTASKELSKHIKTHLKQPSK